MAEAPTATQTPPAEAAAPPQTDLDASLAALNEVMREAEIAANAQRDLEAAGIPIDEAADEQQPLPADDEADLPDETQTPEPEPEPPPQPTEQKRYSRRDAARLDTELQEATRRLNDLSSRTLQYEQTDRAILGHLSNLTGADGRYEQLSQKVLDGSATRDESHQVQQMTEWRKVAGPIYRVAQQEVWHAFGNDFAELKKLDGVTEPVYQELLQTPNPAQMLRKVFDLGVAAGERRKASDATRLEAALTDVRTKRVSERPQPVPASNGAPTNNGRLIDRMFRADGTLDPEYERRAEKGEFLGVDLTK